MYVSFFFPKQRENYRWFIHLDTPLELPRCKALPPPAPASLSAVQKAPHHFFFKLSCAVPQFPTAQWGGGASKEEDCRLGRACEMCRHNKQTVCPWMLFPHCMLLWQRCVFMLPPGSSCDYIYSLCPIHLTYWRQKLLGA